MPESGARSQVGQASRSRNLGIGQVQIATGTGPGADSGMSDKYWKFISIDKKALVIVNILIKQHYLTSED